MRLNKEFMLRFKNNITIFVFVSLFVFSPKTNAQVSSSNELFSSLGDLKKNMERVNVENQTIALKNEKLKAELKDLQISYEKLNQENLQLTESQLKLQKSIDPKNQQIERLNQSLSELNSQQAAWDEQVKDFQQKITALKQQDEYLSDPSKQSDTSVADLADKMSEKLSDIAQQKQKQKLAMLKLIADSQNQQALLQAKYLDYQRGMPGGAEGFDLDNKKAGLEAQIAQLQNEIMQLNSIVNSSKPAWSEEQIRQLESSVLGLEKNREELRVLIGQVHQKAQKLADFKKGSPETLKLESNIENLQREAKNLRIDLEELQQVMVGLDKRKAYLEALLQN